MPVLGMLTIQIVIVCGSYQDSRPSGAIRESAFPFYPTAGNLM